MAQKRANTDVYCPLLHIIPPHYHHHHHHFAPLPGLSRAISHQNFWFCKHGLVETHERSPFTWGGHPYTSDHGLATDCSNPCLPLYRRPLGGRPASSSGRYGTFCILNMRSTLSKFFFVYYKETIQGSETRSRVTLEELPFVLVLVQGAEPHFARNKTYPRSFPAKMEL